MNEREFHDDVMKELLQTGIGRRVCFRSLPQNSNLCSLPGFVLQLRKKTLITSTDYM